MPVVTHTVIEPGGRVPRVATYKITLVASTSGTAQGHDLSANVSIGGQWEGSMVSGGWSETLKANSLITPAGTVYKVVERIDDDYDVNYISVPLGVGPYQFERLLTQAPASIIPAHVHNDYIDGGSAVSIISDGLLVFTGGGA